MLNLNKFGYVSSWNCPTLFFWHFLNLFDFGKCLRFPGHWWPLSPAIPLPPMTENPKRETILGLGIPDYVAVIFQCWRLKLMVLEVLLALYLSCRAFQLKRNWNVIFLKFQTTTRTILLSQLRRVLIDQIDSNSGVCPPFEKSLIETDSVTIVPGKLLNSNTRGRICTTLRWLTSHSISYLGSRVNNAPQYLELKLTFQDRRLWKMCTLLLSNIIEFILFWPGIQHSLWPDLNLFFCTLKVS